MCYECCVVLKEFLLLSGNVELNPGPDIEVHIERISKDIAEIKTSHLETQQKITQIEGRLTTMESKLSKLRALKDRTNTETQMVELQKTAAELTVTIDNIENRSRRNNLIIHGLDEAVSAIRYPS